MVVGVTVCYLCFVTKNEGQRISEIKNIKILIRLKMKINPGI